MESARVRQDREHKSNENGQHSPPDGLNALGIDDQDIQVDEDLETTTAGFKMRFA